MHIAKHQVIEMIKHFPEEVDIEELMCWLYLRKNRSCLRGCKGRQTYLPQ